MEKKILSKKETSKISGGRDGRAIAIIFDDYEYEQKRKTSSRGYDHLVPRDVRHHHR